MGKSWNSVRKMLEEDFLCEKLRGRVQYFFTIYHNAPDQYGRFAIRVDGKEIYQANPYNESYCNKLVNELHEKENIPHRLWDGKEFVFDEECIIIEDKATLMAIADGKADSYIVINSIMEYINTPIEKALSSENYVLRMLAVLDRRVGKRTLSKLAEDFMSLPEWLKRFYRLRFIVEGIQGGKNE